MVKSRDNILVQVHHMQRAPLSAVVRLAAFLGIDTTRRDGETDGPYRHRISHAIMREQKRSRREPRK